MSDTGFHLCGGPSEHMKGVRFTFSNGVTVSVQWGRGSYSENRDDHTSTTSPNAEVTAWDKGGKWITKQITSAMGEESTEDVLGWVDPEYVLRFMVMAAAWKETV